VSDEDAEMNTTLVDLALDALRRDRPEIAQPPIRMIYTGFSSIVVGTGSGYIVRVGRNAQAAESHEREWRLLPLLGELPSVVPAPVWHLPPGPESPYGAVAYPLIEGTSLPSDRPCPEHLIDQLAQFLARLHAITDPAVRAAVDSLNTWRTGRLTAAEAAIGHLARDLPAVDHARLARWFDDEYQPWMEGIGEDAAVVVHGDFWHDNLLTGPAGLTGVIDWEAAELADPAVDLAPVWDIDPALGAALLRRYQDHTGDDDTLAGRVRRARVARNLGDISWSVDNDDADEYAGSLIKVRSVLSLIP
jgi:aminoglycoside phosphotransferase (APT) family kinase protein